MWKRIQRGIRDETNEKHWRGESSSSRCRIKHDHHASSCSRCPTTAMDGNLQAIAWATTPPQIPCPCLMCSSGTLCPSWATTLRPLACSTLPAAARPFWPHGLVCFSRDSCWPGGRTRWREARWGTRHRGGKVRGAPAESSTRNHVTSSCLASQPRRLAHHGASGRPLLYWNGASKAFEYVVWFIIAKHGWWSLETCCVMYGSYLFTMAKS
jgi:hypothetical protein